MSAVIQVLGLASTEWEPKVPTWIETCDFDARDGIGEARLTTNPDRAITFETALEAFDYWRTQSSVRPLRDDGMPNRPLTAYTVSVETT